MEEVLTNNFFSNLELPKYVLKKLEYLNIKEPTEVQEKVIPILMDDDANIIVEAPTGTGKTLTFVLPAIKRLLKDKKKKFLIITPTRELTEQIYNVMIKFIPRGVNILKFYGGTSLQRDFRNLEIKDPSVIIATPGRLIDLVNRGRLNISNIDYLILDEADRMLDMGFIDDIKLIISKVENKNNYLWLFSATIGKEVLDIFKSFIKERKYFDIRIENKVHTTNIEFIKYFVNSEKEKREKLYNLVKNDKELYSIIFCNTKKEVNELEKYLKSLGVKVISIHGDFSQRKRNFSLKIFKERKVNLLIATNVMARGIDVNNLSHVINYSLPTNFDEYIHRTGRTARASRQGVVIDFISEKDRRRYFYYHKKINNINSKVVNNKSELRLFVGLGRRDGMNIKKLKSLIVNILKIRDRFDLKNVVIKDKFIFFTINKELGEIILKEFKKLSKNKRPLIELAKRA